MEVLLTQNHRKIFMKYTYIQTDGVYSLFGLCAELPHFQSASNLENSAFYQPGDFTKFSLFSVFKRKKSALKKCFPIPSYKRCSSSISVLNIRIWLLAGNNFPVRSLGQSSFKSDKTWISLCPELSLVTHVLKEWWIYWKLGLFKQSRPVFGPNFSKKADFGLFAKSRPGVAALLGLSIHN